MDSASYNEPYTEDASAHKTGSYTPQFNVAQHGTCARNIGHWCVLVLRTRYGEFLAQSVSLRGVWRRSSGS